MCGDSAARIDGASRPARRERREGGARLRPDEISCYKYGPVMLIARARLARHASAMAVTALLLAALAVALPLDGGQLPHQHGGGTAAVYNANCPLLAVAACHSAGLVVAPASTPAMPESADVAAFSSGGRLFTPIVRHADFRAPPLV
jgi:hypothetical protein